jgi:hypothetical protein
MRTGPVFNTEVKATIRSGSLVEELQNHIAVHFQNFQIPL